MFFKRAKQKKTLDSILEVFNGVVLDLETFIDTTSGEIEDLEDSIRLQTEQVTQKTGLANQAGRVLVNVRNILE